MDENKNINREQFVTANDSIIDLAINESIIHKLLNKNIITEQQYYLLKEKIKKF